MGKHLNYCGKYGSNGCPAGTRKCFSRCTLSCRSLLGKILMRQGAPFSSDFAIHGSYFQDTQKIVENGKSGSLNNTKLEEIIHVVCNFAQISFCECLSENIIREQTFFKGNSQSFCICLMQLYFPVHHCWEMCYSES